MDQVTETSLYRPKPSDLIAFLPFACRRLEEPFHLRMRVTAADEYASKLATDDKGKKSRRDKTTPHLATSAGQHVAGKKASVSEPDLELNEKEMLLYARCDTLGRPVELLFHRWAQVPRVLMKIIGLCIPYNEQLAKIIVRWGPLDGSVLYEIAKLLPLSHITEIHLEGLHVLDRNYYILLERQSQLRSLTLAHCCLEDEDCVALAARLAYPLPASHSLSSLSLVSNHIRDVGACALGEALRTNRSLRHLNLAGNSITSLGAAHILRSLARFSVSKDEMILKKMHTFEYLKIKKDAYTRCYRELTESTEQALDKGRRPTRSLGPRSCQKISKTSSCLMSAKCNSADELVSRAQAMATELVGVRAHPFDSSQLVDYDDVTYCLGNFNLCYLNMAYNDLDCTSVRRLVEVLTYQVEARQRSGPGLLRVVLEGNALPATCQAARATEDLLERTMAGAGGGHLQQLKPGRKSERPKYKLH